MDAFIHITLNSGDARISPRSEVGDDTIAMLKPVVAAGSGEVAGLYNPGDVMVEGDQIYGDGVSVTARLESLADSSGVCVSGTVYEQVCDKLALSYYDRAAMSIAIEVTRKCLAPRDHQSGFWASL